MKMRRIRVLAADAIVLLICVPVLFAHHGTNVSYQGDKSITLNGTVTEFSFAYPHVQLYFEVKDETGKAMPWASELPGTPVMLRNYRVGWSKTAIKTGDQITLTCHPSKVAGARACLGEKLIINGKELPLRNPGGRGGGEEGN